MSGLSPAARSDLRVVITHDFAEIYGGAERVTEVLAAEFPTAEVWTLLGRDDVAERMGIAGRWHSLLPANDTLLRRYRTLTPLYPALTRARRLPEADVVLSSSYAFAHYLRTLNDAPQVCYCHSPLRFAWSMTEAYQSIWSSSSIGDVGFRSLAAMMRRSDRKAAARVDRYLTQSPYTADQISRFYGRTPEVIGAPIDCNLFKPGTGERDDFFLIVGRLIEPYKRVGVAVEAFRRLGLPLVVAGDGPAFDDLRRNAPPNVTFLGQQGDREVVDLMQRCRALIFPSQDDFDSCPSRRWPAARRSSPTAVAAPRTRWSMASPGCSSTSRRPTRSRRRCGPSIPRSSITPRSASTPSSGMWARSVRAFAPRSRRWLAAALPARRLRPRSSALESSASGPCRRWCRSAPRAATSRRSGSVRSRAGAAEPPPSGTTP